MSKRCAKCEKTVYPTEELKCLDKVWHKACFKCQECGMTLNMKNYKGYNKLPYCNAHYPTTAFTAVADTPEMARIAQNTKIQSNLKYHEDFEKARGKYTAVTDDPETRRLLANTDKFSSIKYHEDFEKNVKGKKLNVADDPETLRIQEHGKVISNVEYHGLKQKHDDMERRRTSVNDDIQPGQMQRRPSDRDHMGGGGGGDQHVPSPYSAKFAGHSTTYSAGGKVEHSQPRRQVGSISDYDPMGENWGSLAKGYNPSGGVAGRQEWEETIPQPGRQTKQSQQPRYYPAPQQPTTPTEQQGYKQPSPRGYQQPPPPAQPVRKGPVYVAMYDYEAQDEDEVGFRENDHIVDTEIIDEGWMYGTVERTGKRGMLPSNYVERI